MDIPENIGGHFDTKYHLIHTHTHTHTHIYISRMKDENIGFYGYIGKYR